MSRSRRKTPICGITCSESEKKDKQLGHRKFRRKVKSILSVNPFSDIFPTENEIMNVWEMSKDGKQYFGVRKSKHKSDFIITGMRK